MPQTIFALRILHTMDYFAHIFGFSDFGIIFSVLISIKLITGKTRKCKNLKKMIQKMKTHIVCNGP